MQNRLSIVSLFPKLFLFVLFLLVNSAFLFWEKGDSNTVSKVKNTEGGYQELTIAEKEAAMAHFSTLVPMGTCAEAIQICNGVTVGAATGGGAAEVGPNYNCLSTRPNPSWLYVKIATGGTMSFNISLNPNADVDYIVWGPFTTPTCAASLSSAKVKSCNYSTANGGTANLGTVAANEYYMICLTNFSGVAGSITVTVNGTSTATLACPPVTPTPCNCATQGVSCGLNTVANQTAADAMIAGNTFTAYDVRSSNNTILYPNNAYQYCVNYTTGASETRIGVRQFATLVTTCSFTRTYSVKELDCATNATFVSAGGTYNYQFYTVQPNTTYRICANITAFTGTCNIPSAGEPDAEILTSSFIVFNATPVAAFNFNCGTAAISGTFNANGTGGQTGSLAVPITGVTAGATTFSVSGTGFTGSLSTTLTAGQTSVVIPITYDGSGSAGTRTLTVTSPQGTGACSKSVTIQNAPPAFVYAYNCMGNTVRGTFIANNQAGQTGTVTIPINILNGGSTSFTVTGTGFTGALSTTITNNQTFATIPIVYDGSGTEGSRILTITSPHGTGSCSVQVLIKAACQAEGGRIGQ
jgi:hypothetical protein